MDLLNVIFQPAAAVTHPACGGTKLQLRPSMPSFVGNLTRSTPGISHVKTGCREEPNI